MKLILVLGVLPLNAFAISNVEKLRQDKAVEMSKTCIQTATTTDEIKSCNFERKTFPMQEQQEDLPNTGTTTEKVRSED